MDMTGKEKDERRNESSVIERQTIRWLCIALGFLSLVAALQLFVTYTFTNYDSWIQQLLGNNIISTAVILTPFVLGLGLLYGKWKRKKNIVMLGLNTLWIYNLSMALLNGVAYTFQGTPMMLHLTVGVIALILHGYYKQREDYGEKLDKELL